MDYRLTDLYERRLRPLYDALDSGNWKVRLEVTAYCQLRLLFAATSLHCEPWAWRVLKEPAD